MTSRFSSFGHLTRDVTQPVEWPEFPLQHDAPMTSSNLKQLAAMVEEIRALVAAEPKLRLLSLEGGGAILFKSGPWEEADGYWVRVARDDGPEGKPVYFSLLLRYEDSKTPEGLARYLEDFRELVARAVSDEFSP